MREPAQFKCYIMQFMQSLTEIFADNADKARLITVLFSVLVALVVVYLTHFLAYRRSRMELNSKKMEDIYSTVTDFANIGWKYMHELAGPNEQTLDTMSAYSEAFHKVEMLASIYADDISKDIAAMNELVILTKDGGREDLSRFPEKLGAFIKTKSKILQKVASRARRLV